MKRREFVKKCSYACLGASMVTPLLQACVSSKNIAADIQGTDLVVPRSSFTKEGKELQYLVVSNSRLQFPIYLFKLSTNNYSALYMQCTHQGNELTAYGDKMVCSAHGSEFDNRGYVTSGPAIDSLRSFSTKLTNKNIFISLKES